MGENESIYRVVLTDKNGRLYPRDFSEKDYFEKAVPYLSQNYNEGDYTVTNLTTSQPEQVNAESQYLLTGPDGSQRMASGKDMLEGQDQSWRQDHKIQRAESTVRPMVSSQGVKAQMGRIKESLDAASQATDFNAADGNYSIDPKSAFQRADNSLGAQMNQVNNDNILETYAAINRNRMAIATNGGYTDENGERRSLEDYNSGVDDYFAAVMDSISEQKEQKRLQQEYKDIEESINEMKTNGEDMFITSFEKNLKGLIESNLNNRKNRGITDDFIGPSAPDAMTVQELSAKYDKLIKKRDALVTAKMNSPIYKDASEEINNTLSELSSLAPSMYSPAIPTTKEGYAAYEKTMDRLVKELAEKRGVSLYNEDGTVNQEVKQGLEFDVRNRGEIWDAINYFNKQTELIMNASSKDEAGWSSFWKGTGKTFSDTDFWTMGLESIASNFEANHVFNRLREKLGRQITTNDLENDKVIDSLSEEEQALIRAFLNYGQAQALRADTIHSMYGSGQTFANSIGFMAQFMLTGGVAEGVDDVAKALSKSFSKKLLNRTATKMSSGTGKALGMKLSRKGFKVLATIEQAAFDGLQAVAVPIAKAVPMTFGQTGIYKDLSQKLVETDEYGNFKYNAAEAFKYAIRDGGLEVYSEIALEPLLGILGKTVKFGAGKLNIDKFLKGTKLEDFWMALHNTNNVTEILHQAGFHGFLEEVGEEIFAAGIASAWDSDQWKEFWKGENLASMIVAFAPTSVLGGGASMVNYMNMQQKYAENEPKLRGLLQRMGYTDAQIDGYLNREVNTLSDIAEKVSNIINPILENKNIVLTGEDFRTIYKFVESTACNDIAKKLQEKDGEYERSVIADAIKSRMRDINFATTHKDGMGRDVMDGVNFIDNEDGTRTYVITNQKNASGETLTISEDGKPKFVKADDLQDMQSMSYKDFLDNEVERRKNQAEQEKAYGYSQEAFRNLKGKINIGDTVNLKDGEGNLVPFVLKAWDGNAAIVVDSEGNEIPVSAKSIAASVGMDLEMLSSRTIQKLYLEKAAKYEAIVRSADILKGVVQSDGSQIVRLYTATDNSGDSHLYMQYVKKGKTSVKEVDYEDIQKGITDLRKSLGTVSNEDVKKAEEEKLRAQEEQDAIEMENAVKKYTDANGEVDEETFMTNDLDLYLKWSDAQEGRDSAYTDNSLKSNIAEVEKSLADLEQQINSEPNTNKKERMAREYKKLQNRLDKLNEAWSKRNPDQSSNGALTPEEARQKIKEMEDQGISRDEITDLAMNAVAEAEQAMQAIAKPKISADIAAYKKAKEAYAMQVEEQQKKIDYWNSILDAPSELGEKAQKTQEAYDSMFGEGAAIAVSSEDFEEVMRENGVDEVGIGQVRDMINLKEALARKGINYTVNAWTNGGKVYIFADEADINDQVAMTRHFQHENQHVKNALVDASGKTAVDRVRAMTKGWFKDAAEERKFWEATVQNLSGTHAYDGKDVGTLIDEALAFSLQENGITNVVKSLQDRGIKDNNFINLINDIANGKHDSLFGTERNTNAGDSTKGSITADGRGALEESGSVEGQGLRPAEESNWNSRIDPAVRQEMDAVKAQALADGTYMLAPNGQDTNLNEEQWCMVRTSNFKNWFGDWEKNPEEASKVVDENGEPKVVYHGTSVEDKFWVFDTYNYALGDLSNVGSHFGPKETAEEFADSNLYAVYLNMKKVYHAPFDFFADNNNNAYLEVLLDLRKQCETADAQDIFNRIYDVYPLLYDYDLDSLSVLEEFSDDEGLEEMETRTTKSGMKFTGPKYLTEHRNAMVEIMKDMMAAEGFDGISYENMYEGEFENECYVALEPNQIKSATENTGLFDNANNDIRFSITTLANAAGLTFDKRGSATVFLDQDGNVVDKVTSKMIEKSYLGSMINQGVRVGFITRKQARKQYQFFADLFTMMQNTQDIDLIWAVSGTVGFQPVQGPLTDDQRDKNTDVNIFAGFTANSDPQYTKTVDFTTICLKTQAIIDAMSLTMKKLGRGLSPKEIIDVIFNETHKAGEPVPCPVCYVFSRWINLGGLFDKMKMLQQKYENMNDEEIRRSMESLSLGIEGMMAESNETRTDKIIEELVNQLKDHQIGLKADLENIKGGNAVFESDEEFHNYVKDVAERLQLEADKYLFLAEAQVPREIEAALSQTRRTLDLLDEYSWLKNVRSDPEYKERGHVPDDILFDMNKGIEFANKYPLAWAFRTTRGPAMGKAASPYSPLHLGQVVTGLSKASLEGIEDINQDIFLQTVDKERQLNEEIKIAKKQVKERLLAEGASTKGITAKVKAEVDRMMKEGSLPYVNTAQDTTVDAAVKRMRIQNLFNGQRFQSTSDFRFEYMLDYLLAVLELQTVGGKIQMYTKVPESINFLASCGAEINCSLMAMGTGIAETDMYWPTTEGHTDREKYWWEGGCLRARKGELVFSNITGMDDRDAQRFFYMYDNVQPIIVGISDEQMKLCMASPWITFIIPFHASGGTEDNYRSMMQTVGEAVKDRTDYAAYEHDHIAKVSHYVKMGMTKAEAEQKVKDQAEARKVRVKLLSGQFLTKEAFKSDEVPTADDLVITEEEKAIIRGFEPLNELFKRFYGVNVDGEVEEILPAYLNPSNSDRTQDDECYRNFMPAGLINTEGSGSVSFMPYEYWDKTSTIKNADVNGKRFLEYCDKFGYHPRFSGWTGTGSYVESKDFSQVPGYWKTLIDRRMYNRDGSFHEQKPVDMTNLGMDYFQDEERRAIVPTDSGVEVRDKLVKARSKGIVTPSRLNDPTKTEEIANRSVERIEDMRLQAEAELKAMNASLEDQATRAQTKAFNENLKKTGVKFDRSMDITKGLAGMMDAGLRKTGTNFSVTEQEDINEAEEFVNGGITIPGTRFMFVGYQGLLKAAKTEEEKKAVKDNFNVAKRAFWKRTPSEDEQRRVKFATGWELGADGKLRYEQPTGDFNDNVNLEDLAQRQDKVTVADIWNDKALLDAYPQIGEIEVKVTDLDSNVHGSINESYTKIELNKNVNKAVLSGTMVHELQHAVQGIEGWAKGGDPMDFMGEINRDAETSGLDEEGKNKLAKEKYRKLAGEVEARNSTTRSKFTEREIRNTLSKNTEDVPRDEQIVKFTKENNDIRFSVENKNQEVFVSNALKAVESLNMGKATGANWLKAIQGKGGLKAGEDKWLGLSEWLNERGDKPVTKQELQDFINENKIQIEEVHYSEEGIPTTMEDIDKHPDVDYALTQFNEEFNNLMSEYYEFGMNEEGDEDDPYQRGAVEYAEGQMEERYPGIHDFFQFNANGVDLDGNKQATPKELLEFINGEGYQTDTEIDGTRLHYTTDGLENNREIALTVPTIEPYNQKDEVHFGDAGNGRAVAWIRFGDVTLTSENHEEKISPLEEYKESLRKKYNDPHFLNITKEEKEKLLELFENGSTVAKPRETGKRTKVLVIDEIQSKRHQDGRERGYAEDKLSPAGLHLVYSESGLYRFADAEGNIMARSESEVGKFDDLFNATYVMPNDEQSNAISEYRKENGFVVNGVKLEKKKVPDAPFDKNWHELAFKRMLRLAAEEGYDKIAWTSGNMQSERYNLSKYITYIELVSEEKGIRKYELSGLGATNNVKVDANGNIVDSSFDANVQGEPLSSLVGKELAEKMTSLDINDEDNRDLDANELVGGEGMKGFYDKMLVSFANKYGKKWGSKVEDLTLPGLENEDGWHSMDITPEMKESVMNGQTMFSATSSLDTASSRVYEMSDTGTRFSIRTKPAPKETKPVWKLMRLGKDGLLYPLYIDRNSQGLELKKWYDADSPQIKDLKNLEAGYSYLIDQDGNVVDKIAGLTGQATSITGTKPSKDQIREAAEKGMRWIGITHYANGNKCYVNIGISGSTKNKNGEGGVSGFAMRPGWHAGSLPSMKQIKGRSDDMVWVKGYVAYGNGAVEEAAANGGEINDHIPYDGGYSKATSSFNEKNVDWYISGAFMPEEIMSDLDARKAIDEWNKDNNTQVPYDVPRPGNRVFNAKTMQLEEGPKTRFMVESRFPEQKANLKKQLDAEITKKAVDYRDKYIDDRLASIMTPEFKAQIERKGILKEELARINTLNNPILYPDQSDRPARKQRFKQIMEELKTIGEIPSRESILNEDRTKIDMAMLRDNLLDKDNWVPIAAIPEDILNVPEIAAALDELGWDGKDGNVHSSEYRFVSHRVDHHPEMEDKDYEMNLQENLSRPIKIVINENHGHKSVAFIRETKVLNQKYHVTIVAANQYMGKDGKLEYTTAYYSEKEMPCKTGRLVWQTMEPEEATNRLSMRPTVGRGYSDANVNINTESANNSFKNSQEKLQNKTKLSITGERGARNDASNEGYERRRNLVKAKEMEAELNPDWMSRDDADALKIKVATGWERGADGEWRYEIPDGSIRENPKLERKEWEVDGSIRYEYTGTLYDLYDAPELYSIYPFLKDLTVEINPYMEGREGGFFSYPAELIKVVSRYTRFVEPEHSERYKELEAKLEDAFDAAEAEGKDLLVAEAEWEATDEGKELNELSQKEKGHFEAGFPGYEREGSARKTLVHEIQHAIQYYEGFARGGSQRDPEYKGLGGEVESRNTEARLLMTPEQRRNTLLASTEDVGRKYQVHRGVGKQEDYGTFFSITPEQDKAYMDAVNSGDMAKAQAMVNAAASAAGYNSDNSWRMSHQAPDRSTPEYQLLNPVTYDDAGNVIPLSKRFNKRESDVRFSFTGTQGAERLDSFDKGERIANQLIAEQMEKEGKTPKVIKDATGWERGADGKWRYEMRDGKFKDFARIAAIRNSRTSVKLGEVWDDENLYTAYPQLRDIPVYKVSRQADYEGSYNGSYIEVPANSSEIVTAQTLVHEIQHAIQDYEGFAKGGNSRMRFDSLRKMAAEHDLAAKAFAKRMRKKYPSFDIFSPYSSAYSLQSDQEFLKEGLETLNLYEAAINKYPKLFEGLESKDVRKWMSPVSSTLSARIRECYPDVDSWTDKTLLGLRSITYNTWRVASESPVTLEDVERLRKAINDSIESYDAFNRKWEKKWKSIGVGDYRYDGILGFEGYLKLAGEVESRNVAKRYGMTDKQRKSTAASTEDTKRKDQLFINNNGKDLLTSSDLSSLSQDGVKFSVSSKETRSDIQHQSVVDIAEMIKTEDGLGAVISKSWNNGQYDGDRMYHTILDGVNEKLGSEMSYDEIEKYLADLTEKETLSAEEQEVLKHMKTQLSSILAHPDATIDNWMSLSDNDVKYILYRAAHYKDKDIIQIAHNIMVERELGFGKGYTQGNIEIQNFLDVASKKKDDLMAQYKAMKAVLDELDSVKKAARLRKNYDRQTVDGLVELCRMLQESGLVSGMTNSEGKSMDIAIRDANGKEDISAEVDRLYDVVLKNQLRRVKDAFEKTLKTKATRIKFGGVVVQGSQDVQGQDLFQRLRDYLGYNDKDDMLSKDELEKIKSDAEEKLRSESERVAEQAAFDYTVASMALDYNEKVKDSIANEKAIRRSLDEADTQRKAGEITSETFHEMETSAFSKIREERAERLESWMDLTQQLIDLESAGHSRALDFIQADIENKKDIQHDANRDTEGKSTAYVKNRYGKPGEPDAATRFERFSNRSLTRVVLGSVATFDQILRYFGRYNVRGEGFLHNRFMRGWIDASSNERVGRNQAFKALENKLFEVFGKKMDWRQFGRIEKSLPSMKVSYFNGEGMKEYDLSQGKLMYILMVDRMSDGRTKLRHMGISEEVVEQIRSFVDPRLVTIADWLQDEFLPSRREVYNATHQRLFGASLSKVENYFPLRIDPNSRLIKDDISQPQPEAPGISTTTGAIKKRVHNNCALDLINTDAFQVVDEHITEMEHWNAFAEWTRDMNTLLNYTTFKNKVQNMRTLRFGSGEELYKNFRDCVSIAAGTYKPQTGKHDKAVMAAASGVTAGKIAFRFFTAFKQFLSYPAYFSEASVVNLAKNTNPYGMVQSWKWAMNNLPLFEKRVMSRTAGDHILPSPDTWNSRLVQWLAERGMSANAFVDALTVSIGAKSIYDTKYKQYLKMGFDESYADRRAKQDAVILYNETQQSNEDAFLSSVQKDRTVWTSMVTVFRNSSMGYERQMLDACAALARRFEPGFKERSIEFMAKQFYIDGLDEEQARDAAEKLYTRQLFRDMARVAIFGWVMQFAWNLGPDMLYLLWGNGGGDDDDKKKTKEEMIKDAAIHALAGPVEGLVLGNVMSDAWNTIATKGKLKDLKYALLPLFSDLQTTISKADKDAMAAINDVVNLGVQIGFGVNSQTVSDWAAAVSDLVYMFRNDVKTTREFLIFFARITEFPSSQIEKIYLDEIKMTMAEAKGKTMEELAERYARYKFNKNSGVASLLYSAFAPDRKEELIEETMRRMEDKVKDNLSDKEFEHKFAQLTDDSKDMVKMIQKLRKDAKDGDADADARLSEIFLSDTGEYGRLLRFNSLSSDMNDELKAAINAKTNELMTMHLEEYDKLVKEISDDFDGITQESRYRDLFVGYTEGTLGRMAQLDKKYQIEYVMKGPGYEAEVERYKAYLDKVVEEERVNRQRIVEIDIELADINKKIKAMDAEIAAHTQVKDDGFKFKDGVAYKITDEKKPLTARKKELNAEKKALSEESKTPQQAMSQLKKGEGVVPENYMPEEIYNSSEFQTYLNLQYYGSLSGNKFEFSEIKEYDQAIELTDDPEIRMELKRLRDKRIQEIVFDYLSPMTTGFDETWSMDDEEE